MPRMISCSSAFSCLWWSVHNAAATRTRIAASTTPLAGADDCVVTSLILVLLSLSRRVCFVGRRPQSNVGEVELDVSRTQLKLESFDYSLTVRTRSTGDRTVPYRLSPFRLGMEDCGRNGR